MSGIKCRKCGKEIKDNEINICYNCGAFWCNNCVPGAAMLCPNCFNELSKLN